MPEEPLITYLTSGCLGDILYSLPSIQALGAGHYYFCDRIWTKPLLHRVQSLIPLLETQPCILGTSIYKGEEVTHDFSTFRNGGQRYGETIISRQARWVRAKVDISKPWLFVSPDPRSSGRIIVNRCDRWVGWKFPWVEVVEEFQKELLFVGLADEHADFCKEFGKIEYAPTNSLLEVAGLIAGAELLIGNQSCPLAIAEGLHKRTIVEICCWAPDCFHLRPGNIHYIDGTLQFEALGRTFISGPERISVNSEKEELIERCLAKYASLK